MDAILPHNFRRVSLYFARFNNRSLLRASCSHTRSLAAEVIPVRADGTFRGQRGQRRGERRLSRNKQLFTEWSAYQISPEPCLFAQEGHGNPEVSFRFELPLHLTIVNAGSASLSVFAHGHGDIHAEKG
jgi:hypothetical protein